jgi:hypothetical protein
VRLDELEKKKREGELTSEEFTESRGPAHPRNERGPTRISPRLASLS